jgi:hypothetical protein
LFRIPNGRKTRQNVPRQEQKHEKNYLLTLIGQMPKLSHRDIAEIFNTVSLSNKKDWKVSDLDLALKRPKAAKSRDLFSKIVEQLEHLLSLCSAKRTALRYLILQ